MDGKAVLALLIRLFMLEQMAKLVYREKYLNYDRIATNGIRNIPSNVIIRQTITSILGNAYRMPLIL